MSIKRNNLQSNSIVILLLCQFIGTICCTRLPLEVYELTANAVTTARTIPTVQQLSSTNSETQNHYSPLKHKNFEYSIVEPIHENDTFDEMNYEKNDTNNVTDNENKIQINSQPLDRRRSRQMLDDIQDDKDLDMTNDQHTNMLKQHQQQHLNNYHNAAAVSLYLQKLYQHHQQQQQQQTEKHKQLKDNNDSDKKYTNNNNNNNKKLQQNQDVIGLSGLVIHGKPVRILYQVGDSEEDLPICTPNAVCSKIDLYETPWIERQCRCPDPNRIIHYHYKVSDNNKNRDDAIEIITTRQAQDQQAVQQHQLQHLTHAEKMRNYYEQEKMLQQHHNKRLLLADYNDKKFESLHFRKLMQKLGAIYEDDLHIQPSDYLGDHEDNNDALPVALKDIDEEYESNEFSHGSILHGDAVGTTTSKTHMRHSGHMGHKVKDISFIGGCPSSLGIEDGHTIADKTRHYKLCQPVHKLPVCKHFRDYTWTLTTSNDLNVTEQIVHCRCPKNSVTYLTKREPALDGSSGYTYLFACSPLTRIRCQRKQPCKLFTVRKRQEFLDEVNINALCQCPKGHHCPSHHTQSGVIAGESFLEDNIQTYSGYCMTND